MKKRILVLALFLAWSVPTSSVVAADSIRMNSSECLPFSKGISDENRPEGATTYYYKVSGSTSTYTTYGKNTMSKLIRDLRLLGSGDDDTLMPVVRDLAKHFSSFEIAYKFIVGEIPTATYNKVATELEYLYRQGNYVVTVTINRSTYNIREGL